jgi:hypothetical protein
MESSSTTNNLKLFDLLDNNFLLIFGLFQMLTGTLF